MAGLSAALVTALLTPLMRVVAIRAGQVSVPIEDRWGRRVIPRLGGAAMVLGFLLPVLVWAPLERPIVGLVWGVVLAFGLGLADDLHRLRPYTKLLGQLLIGCVVVLHGVRIDLIPWPWLAVPLSVLWLVFMMNAFNLLDNMDGLAAGIGAVGATFCLLHTMVVNQATMTLLAAVVLGACMGFLRYNFPPAKIFMGDSGSHLLGLGLGAITLLGSWKHSTQLLSVLALPLLVLAVPIFDTCFVALQRLLHQRHPFQGGRDHLSHRLVILGLTQRQTLLALYGVAMVLGLLGLASLHLRPLTAFAVWLFALSAILLGGAFLARVKVYEVRREEWGQPPHDSPRPATFIETMLLHKRRLLEVLVDFLLIGGTYSAAYVLRFEGVLDHVTQQALANSLPIVMVIKLLCFLSCGLYRGLWKYVSLSDVMTIFRAITLSSVCSASAVVLLWRFQGFSRAVFVIDWLLLFLAVSGSRVVERLLSEWIASSSSESSVPVVIVGAGDLGELVLRRLRRRGDLRWRPIGFVDDDRAKQRGRLHGIPVLGTRAALPAIIQEQGVQVVVVAIREPSPELLRYTEEVSRRFGVELQVINSLTAAAAP